MQKFLKIGNLYILVTKDVTIYNRKGLGKHIGTPDMIIVIKGVENHVVIVDNKLGDAELITQTLLYEGCTS